MWFSWYLVLLVFVNNGLALNILAIVSEPLRSHYATFGPLFREFAKRGHSITVINNFPDDEPLKNMRFINLQRQLAGKFPNLTEVEGDHFIRMHNYLTGFQVTSQFTAAACEDLLTLPQTKAHLAEGNKYDVVFIEQFLTSDCELAYAATFFDAPIIGITSHVLLPKAYSRLGIPFDIAADPHYFSIGGPSPSLLYKLEAFLANLFFNTLDKWIVEKRVYDTFSRHVPHVAFDLDRLARERMKMMFVSQHLSLTGARLAGPQVLEIGGAHISKPKPVPQDIEEFLSTAKHGAIYVSFGSNLKASTMSPRMLQEFLSAFDKIPQKVLWKWEGDSFPKGHENILVKNWFPQIDVLCHPKVLAFVSHGGMLSVSEAAYCGKPAVAVPFFGDQFSNAAALRASGLGNYLYFQDITADRLADAIKELTSQEMQQSAKRVSKLWHDRPMPVLDSAIYWTEYVARHHGAPPSLPSTHNTWFERMLLDVYSVIFAIIFLVWWICYLTYKLIRLIICRLLCKLICQRKVKTQ